jgi:hypothetical protein
MKEFLTPNETINNPAPAIKRFWQNITTINPTTVKINETVMRNFLPIKSPVNEIMKHPAITPIYVRVIMASIYNFSLGQRKSPNLFDKVFMVFVGIYYRRSEGKRLQTCS